MVDRRQILIGGGALALAGSYAAYLGIRQMGSMDEYDASVARTRTALSQDPATRDFVRYATLAASGHNTQPWRFRIGEGQSRFCRTFYGEPPLSIPTTTISSPVSAAPRRTWRLPSPRGDARERSASIRRMAAPSCSLFGTRASGNSALFDAIPKRQSTRADYDGRPVSAADLKTLAASRHAGRRFGPDHGPAADGPRARSGRCGQQRSDGRRGIVRELKTWLRFSPREAIDTGDGLFSASSGNPTLPAWLGPRVFDWVFNADAENEKYARQLRSSAGVAVFVAQKDDREHWVLAGRACQRFALQATALGLKHAFINQPVEVPSLRPELASLVGLPGRRPDIVMRFGYGPTLPYSARRPVESTLQT